LPIAKGIKNIGRDEELGPIVFCLQGASQGIFANHSYTRVQVDIMEEVCKYIIVQPKMPAIISTVIYFIVKVLNL
jgi:hypothetical protein